jgi:hypothetical protein
MKLLPLLTLLIFSQTVFAHTLEENIPNKKINKFENPHTFQFDYNFMRTKIEHSEESADISFKAFGSSSNYLVHQIGVGYNRELLRGSFFSLTPLVGLGIRVGEESRQDGGSSNKVNSIDSATGYYAHLGISLNLNSYEKVTNTQYFVAARSFQSKTDFFLRYEDVGIDDRSFEISYEEELTGLETSIGVRFFNYNKKLVSTFEITSTSISDETISDDASKGATDYTLTEQAIFKRDITSIRIGVGVLF